MNRLKKGGTCPALYMYLHFMYIPFKCLWKRQHLNVSFKKSYKVKPVNDDFILVRVFAFSFQN